jgi:ABC-type Fe3+ transport system substrate-binding protein
MRSAARSALVAIGAFALMGLDGNGAATAQSAKAPSPELDRIMAAAKQEAVVNKRGFGIPAESLRLLQERFQKRFGFPVKLVEFRQHVVEARGALTLEAKARNIPSDIYWDASSPLVRSPKAAGALQEVDWVKTFGPLFDPAGRQLLEQLVKDVDPDIRSSCLPYEDVVYVVGYNTKRIALKDVPQTYEALLQPKFNRQLVWQSAGFPLDTLGLAWGEEKTLQYARSLRANGVILAGGGSQGSLQTLATGEASIAIVSVTDLLAEKNKGAPIDFVFTKDIIPYFLGNNCVLNGPHPNMAKLFTAWLAVEGRDVIGTPPMYMGRMDDPSSPVGRAFKQHSVDRSILLTWRNAEEAQRRQDILNKVVSSWTQ